MKRKGKSRRRRRHSAKWDRCVKQVKRRGAAVDPAAVCTAALRSHRRNPAGVVLYARAADGTTLHYLGGIKFSRRGSPARFASVAAARGVARYLRGQFPLLRRFKLWVV